MLASRLYISQIVLDRPTCFDCIQNLYDAQSCYTESSVRFAVQVAQKDVTHYYRGFPSHPLLPLAYDSVRQNFGPKKCSSHEKRNTRYSLYSIVSGVKPDSTSFGNPTSSGISDIRLAQACS